ncbi:MAG: polyprenyl glycosylphosphotransferase [Robiginitomaculum sp.]|nr:MAG: polyprenyl glycosylphosphotransferase [Robiginitomaculum sp.]
MVDQVRQQARAGQTPLFLRLRFQLLGGLLFAVFLPAFLQYFLGQPFSSFAGNSMLVANFAFLAGAYILSRITVYPGIRRSFYIIPVFSGVYALALVFLIFLRFDYSRLLLTMSYSLTITWFYVLHYLTSRMQRPFFAIVPAGQTQTLSAVSNADWFVLSATSDGKIDLPPNCQAVITDFHAEMDEHWQRFLAHCALSGTPVFDHRQVRESLTGKVRIKHISENTLGTLVPNIIYIKFKALADFLLAVLVVILAAPILLLIAIAIKLSSPGPVLFRQPRMGYCGKLFVCYKFRSMQGCATSAAQKKSNPLEAAMTRENDPRITRLGKFLRKSRLDELPQIINILKGEMSWIGPRPEAEVLSNWYEEKLPFYSYRHVVRPGISGWAQVNQGHVVEVDDVDQKLQFDFYYIKNFSPWLDIIILFLTLKTIFTGSGAK